ncbi:unnamed protein product [Callosobruchus maculatus]|uniref:MADF domain-containing protein n=1 Tax=Callosobruchus maculatus TaxID=64391 RepID=A0A653DQL6_CALMS|nr:unnamed protein product [Callosobruchus maculatus]
MQWDYKKTLFFIGRYKAYNVLWDPSHKDHYNKMKREDAWSEIADEVDCTVDICKKKMSSILASFRRERQKIKKSRGKGPEEAYHSSWFAYKSLLFLLDRDLPGSTRDSLPPQANSTPPAEQNTDLDLKRPLDNSNDTKPEEPPPRPQKKKRASINPDEIMRSTLDILQRNTDQSSSSLHNLGECDAFGAYVASKLRSYSRQTRIYVEHQVSNILFSADCGEYEYDTTSGALSTSQPVLEPPSPVGSDHSHGDDNLLSE